MSKTLLVNWVYYRPIGHALEGLKVSKGYYEANIDIKISILLNSQMPYELGEHCPWIEKVYIIDVTELAEKGSKAKCLKNIPRNWDYIVSDERLVLNPFSYNDELKVSNQIIIKYFQAEIWKGCRLQPPLKDAPEYKVDTKMRLEVPADAKQFIKRYNHYGLKICFLPAGSAAEHIYPETDWWIAMIAAVTKKFPEVKFYMTGAKSRKGNKTGSFTFSESDIDRILLKNDNVVNCFDIGIINQLALLEYCDILISPHSGFAFLASCVNTPWLSISGVRWPEYFYNHTKFYNVLPSCINYPCFTGMKEICIMNMRKNKSLACMDTKNLENKIPDVIKGINKLSNKKFSYKDSIELYKKNIYKSGFRVKNFWTFDGSFTLETNERREE